MQNCTCQIFFTLVAVKSASFLEYCPSNLYDLQGQRNEQHMVLDEEVINAVQHARLLTRYMASSSKKTEYHKSNEVHRSSEYTR